MFLLCSLWRAYGYRVTRLWLCKGPPPLIQACPWPRVLWLDMYRLSYSRLEGVLSGCGGTDPARCTGTFGPWGPGEYFLWCCSCNMSCYMAIYNRNPYLS
jgi:hypothetical protein